MIEQLKEGETLIVNGCTVTARGLAAARQRLAHDGAHLPVWDELSQAEQATSAVVAAGWLRALSLIVPEDDTAPSTMITNRKGYATHAARQSITVYLSGARKQRARWDSYVRWLEELLITRCEQVANGTWPGPKESTDAR